ncbi:Rho guanine nucleotide exchange factor [Entamoeba marina]
MSFSDKQEVQLIQWVRSHLNDIVITNISLDFRNGVHLVHLASAICNKPLPKLADKPNLRGRIQNIEKAIEMIVDKYGKFEGVSVSCIANGNRDQILSLLWHMKRMRTFEKQRRKQQRQRIAKDLKKFDEKTRQMKSTLNYTFEDKSNTQNGTIRKRAFTVMKSGTVEVTNVTVVKTSDEENRSRALSLLNPIAASKKSKNTKNKQPPAKPKQTPIFADSSNLFVVDQLVNVNQQKKVPTKLSNSRQSQKFISTTNPPKKLERKRAITTLITPNNIQQKITASVEDVHSNHLINDEFSTNEQLKYAKKRSYPIQHNNGLSKSPSITVNSIIKQHSPSDKVDIQQNETPKEYKENNHNNEECDGASTSIKYNDDGDVKEVESTFIGFDDSDDEKINITFDCLESPRYSPRTTKVFPIQPDNKELITNESNVLKPLPSNNLIETSDETNKHSINKSNSKECDKQITSPRIYFDSTSPTQFSPRTHERISSDDSTNESLQQSISPGLTTDESEEETFISFDDDEDLQNCFIQRSCRKQTPPTEVDIKTVSVNVFLMGNTYYEVKDVINGENVLKPVNLTIPHLIATIQSILRVKSIMPQYNYDSQQLKRKLNEIEYPISNQLSSIITIQRRIRGYQIRSSQMWSKMKHLKNAINEIVCSEQRYLEDLSILKLLIEKTIHSLPNVDIVNRAKIVIDTMINCNTVLYNSLSQMSKTDRYGRTISNAFQKFTKYMNYYTTYMNIFFPLKEFYLDTNPKVVSFVQNISKELLKNTKPDNYLIRPIQRPPRYKLLLESVREYYPTWWKSELKKIKKCNDTVKTAVYHLDSCVKKNQQTRDVDLLLKKLVFPRKKVLKKGIPRRLLHEGFLKRVEKKEEEVCCFLLSDVMILTKTKRMEVGDIPSEGIKSKTKVTHLFDNRQITLMDISDTPCAFCICVPGKHYVFRVSSEEEKMTWMHDIDGIFALQQQQISSRITSLHTESKRDFKEQLNVTEFLIHPEYEDSVSYFNQTTGEWEDFYMMLHGNVVCLFLNEVEAATLQQPTLVFDVLSLRFKGLLVSSKKYSFEMNYKNYTYIFASHSNTHKFIWLSLLRNAFYKNCQVHLDLNDFDINVFHTDLLKTWTVFDDIPFSENDNYTYLRMLLLQPHNQICADCLTNKTSFVDIDYGVFICKECALLHIKCNHSKRDYATVLEFEKCLDVPFIALTKLHEYGNVRGTALYSKIAANSAYKPSVIELKENNVMRRRWTLAKYVDPSKDIVDFTTSLVDQ